MKTVEDVKPIDSSEYDDAWNFLIHLEQQQRFDKDKHKGLVPVVVNFQLSNYKILVSQVLLGGRVQHFPESFHNKKVPIVPYGRLGKLIVLHYHNKHHRDIATTVAIVRADVWVLEARKLASVIDTRCVICYLSHYGDILRENC